MTETETEAPAKSADTPEPAPQARAKARPQQKPKLLPPHAVVLYNDDINGFEWVVGVLRKVFRYGGARSFWLTLQAHLGGRSIVWTGSLEVAELRAEQVRSCGADPKKRSAGAQPLRVKVEPLPG